MSDAVALVELSAAGLLDEILEEVRRDGRHDLVVRAVVEAGRLVWIAMSERRRLSLRTMPPAFAFLRQPSGGAWVTVARAEDSALTSFRVVDTTRRGLLRHDRRSQC